MICTCVFLLHQKSFDMILINNPSFYDGGVTVGIRAMSKLSAHWRTLKMASNTFMVRNVFYPYKNYSSFLGGKLTVFKLCNYAGQGKSCDILSLFQIILSFMKLIFFLVNFIRTIRITGVYFVVYALFSYLCLVQTWVRYFGMGPWWTWVTVDDLCDPFSAGTLSRVNSLEHICECILPPIAHSLQ
jgi:hypothetical protein